MFILLLALWSGFAFAQEKINVKNVTPQGFVKSVDQIRIEFAQPMVKLGDIRLDLPAKSTCFKDGQGRWVDTKNWVYDFKSALPGGTLCEVELGAKKYQFHTGGPHVIATFPRLYRPIDPQQNFVLILDSDVDKKTISEGAYFVVKGLGDRIPAVIVDGGAGEKVKNAAKAEYKYDEDDFKKGVQVVLKSSRDFPPGSEVTLVWGEGIKSPSGARSPENETFEYTVTEPFKADFNCDREAANRPCIALLGFRLSFTSAISVEDAKKIYIEGPDKKRTAATNLKDDTKEISFLEFKGDYPIKSQFTVHLPSSLKDIDGRELTNIKKFPLAFKTGEDPVLLKFSAPFGVVEAGPESAVAVTLRRVEQSLRTRFVGISGKLSANDFKEVLRLLGTVMASPYGPDRLKLAGSVRPESIQVKKPLKASETEVVGIPLKKPGFYFLEMESPLLGRGLLDDKKPYFVRSTALVTNLSVHVKFSQTNALVWVTSLKDAKPVAGANVHIYDMQGVAVARVATDKNGLAEVRFEKPLDKWPKAENKAYQNSFYDGFFAVAEKGDDFSFTHSSWDEGVQTWRFQLGLYEGVSGLIGHAILDRTLLKPEETLSAKIVLRKTGTKGLVLPPENEWPKTARLSHMAGLQKFDLPLAWDKKKGTALLNWSIPAGAKMGNWDLTITKAGKDDPELSVGQFSIAAFRVPLVQVKINASSPSFVKVKDVPLQVTGQFFAGGPAMNLPMKLRWSVEQDVFTPQNDDYEGYQFANGSVKEGLFRSGEDVGDKFTPQSGIQDDKLSDIGDSKLTIRGLKYGATPQRLRAEVEYKDPNGEIQSAIRSFEMWPSQVVLGIKSKSWWATPDLVEFNIVAMDTLQRPLPKQKVQVDLYTSRYYSHRKRLVGGFYSYEDIREFKKVGELCEGETNAQGQYSCVGKSKVSGSVLAVVRSKDQNGHIAYANVNQWLIAPGERQWFGSDDDDRADLIPFKKSYEPGETAEFQLRTPFPQARVLVTIERESVIHSEIVEVSGERPVIRLPIKKEYAPNVVVSAFAIRGRLNDPKPTALVDLGKPSFKLGMANIKVGWKENTLKVTVNTDKKSYKARDKAKVTVDVKDFSGRPAVNGEVVLVAVDEGLLELRDNKSWNILPEMMKMRAHSVEFATAQSMVIGKRHFGLKAVPIGGDGSGGLRRELFDTLLYWNPSLKLNAQGSASVEIPLNDSTTSFRIVAVALKDVTQFGTGWTSIQSSQDLMILPGLSSIVREGDDFKAGFTVRNASAQNQEVLIHLKTIPNISGFDVQKVILKSGESKEVFWPIKVPPVGKLEYNVSARSSAGKFLDEIKKTQKVLPLRVARIQQSEWGQWPDFKKVDLKMPVDAEPNKNSVLVDVTDTLGGNTAGIQEFWDNYRYSCLEQQISRLISSNDKEGWRRLEANLNIYLDGAGLLKYFAASEYGSVALTSYVLSITHEAGFDLREGLQDTLLRALENYAEGRARDGNEISRADESIKKIMAFEALSRFRKLNVDLLSTVDYQPNQWPLYSLVEWYQIHLWEKDLPDVQKKLVEIENILRNKFYFSAKRLQLRDEKFEGMSWLMRDADAALMRLNLTVMNQKSWQSDVPRVYQGIMARQQNGSWGLTTDNAWGSILIRQFKEKFAKEKVSGQMKITVGGQSKNHDWKKTTGSYEFPLSSSGMAGWQQIGEGKPWVTVSVKSALPVTKPTFAGFNVEKKVTAVERKNKDKWSIGDIAKIELKVKAAAPQAWVVIEDPIPAGATILSSNFATAVERKDDAIRSYYSWFEGEATLEYQVRFNQSGKFVLPVSRVEAMYSPDIFAELPESQWQVSE